MTTTKAKAKPTTDKPSTPVLMLRTCRPDGSSSHGFRWPLEVGAVVEAPDWNDRPECGGGLHGLPWGEGDGSLLDWSDDTVWMVIEAEADEIVRIDHAKAKCRRATVQFVGNRFNATTHLIEHGARGYAVVGSMLTGGDCSTLIGGDGSTLTGGYDSTLTGGNCSTLTGGDCSTLTGGYHSTLTGGHRSTLTGGHRSTLTGGHYSTLTGGDHSTLTVRRWDGNRYRLHTAYVGENGIKANTPYRLNDRNEWEEVAA